MLNPNWSAVPVPAGLGGRYPQTQGGTYGRNHMRVTVMDMDVDVDVDVDSFHSLLLEPCIPWLPDKGLMNTQTTKEVRFHMQRVWCEYSWQIAVRCVHGLILVDDRSVPFHKYLKYYSTIDIMVFSIKSTTKQSGLPFACLSSDLLTIFEHAI